MMSRLVNTIVQSNSISNTIESLKSIVLDQVDILVLVAGLLIAAYAAYFAFGQWREAKKARILPAYLHFESIIGNPTSRAARKFIYEENQKNLVDPTDEVREKIDLVCVPFDIMGVLVKEKLMHTPLVFSPFYDVIIKVWSKTSPFIHAQRENRENESYMADFEFLYEEAENFRVKKGYKEVRIH